MPEGAYPDDWQEIVATIRERSGGRCECTGECALHRGQRCVEIDGEPARFAGGTIVLTVAHRNHCKSDSRPENLAHLCQKCHLRYDLVLHARNAYATRADDRTVDWVGGRDEPRTSASAGGGGVLDRMQEKGYAVSSISATDTRAQTKI